MKESILQKFADAKFLNAVIKNDEDLDNLELSAAELAKKLKQKNKRHQLPAFILLAINPEIKEDEPLLEEVEQIAKSKNKLLLSRSNSKPLTVLRAIILTAIEILVDVDQKFNQDYGKIIYLTAKESFEFIKYESAEERRIVEDFIVMLGKRGEIFAREKWMVKLEAPKIGNTFELNLKGLEDNSVYKTNFPLGIPEAEFTKHSISYEAYFFIQKEQFNSWRKKFSTSTSKAISKEIDKRIKNQTNTINNFAETISDQLLGFTNQINSYVNDSIKNALGGISSLAERDQLNWWKESLYSSSKSGSYRDISNPIALAFLMSFDCGELTHPHSPESVDYFLKETYIKVEKSSDSLSFKTVLEKLSTEKEWLAKVLPKTVEQTGILALPQFLIGFIHGIYEEEDFEKMTYIKLSEEIKPSFLCIWVFHYFQVNRLTYGN